MVWTSRGHYTSTFIQDTSNNIWAVGANGYGQLGLGHTSHVKIWTRVPALDMVKIQFTILKVMDQQMVVI